MSRIPLARPDITELERDYVRQVMESGWISQGAWVDRAEESLRKLTGRKHAICTGSGTTALIAALMAMDSKPVTVAAPTLTFAAVFNAIELTGSAIHFMGCEAATWQVPRAEYMRAVARSQAIIAAPCYGQLSGMAEAETIARESEIPLIEDASESFTGFEGGRPAGSFGDVSCVSFFSNKIIAAGEGGCCLTDDDAMAFRLRKIVNNGVTRGQYRRECRGLNGRMTDLSAAILVAQLERMAQMVGRRKWIAEQYAIADLAWPVSTPTEARAYWLFAFRLNDHGRIIKAKMAAELADIEIRPTFPCGHGVSNFIKQLIGSPANEYLTEAEKISRYGLVVPLSSALTNGEVERVCEFLQGIRKVYEKGE